MIQRIQSVYLTIIIILSILLLNGSILNFIGESGNAVKLSAAGALSDESRKLIAQVAPAWPVITLLAAISIISLASLLMYRNRRIQMPLTVCVIILSVLLTAGLAWLAYSVVHDLKMTFSPGIKMSFPVLILIFSVIAFLGIRKDERLVKSYDRLR